MNDTLAQKAISQALEGNWEEAVKTNRKILKEDPQDLASLNRLAKAYLELGEISKARSSAKKVLKLDPFNKIATRALEKWKGLKNGENSKSALTPAEAFLEDPGKTKIFRLMHVGNPDILATLDSGDQVNLNYHCHRIEVKTANGKHVGKLQDDISARLKKLVKMGNQYSALIKTVEPNEVTIFIREVKKGNKVKNVVSFPIEKLDYIPYVSPKLLKRNKIEGLNSVEE